MSLSTVISVSGATSLPSTSQVLNSCLSDGAPKLLSGNLYFSPFLTVAVSIEPVPSFPLKVTLYSISFQTALTSVSLSTVISVPGATSLPSTSQVLNSCLSDGAPKLLSGNLYFSPFLTVASVIVPVPSFPLKVTLYSMSFQVAVKVTSPEIPILSPAFFTLASPGTFQPANTLSFGAVNVGVGSSNSLPFVTVFSSIEPVAPSPGKNSALNSMGFHEAFMTVSLVMVMSVPGLVTVVAPLTNHPANS